MGHSRSTLLTLLLCLTTAATLATACSSSDAVSEGPALGSSSPQGGAGTGGQSSAGSATTSAAGTAGSTSAAGAAGAAGAPSTASPPNVLVILVDDLGYGDLSCYGARDIETPSIDQLAASGMRFTQFYANSPVCSPTRAALLTGRFPDLVGVPGVIRLADAGGGTWGNLSDDATLLTRPLGDSGYDTAIVGKWHLGYDAPDTPLDRGFGFFHGYLGDMMDSYYTHTRDGVNWMRLNRDVIDPVGHATDLFSDWAVEYLASRKDQPAPFFLYLAYTAPHAPIQPPPEWLDKVKQREPGITDQRAELAALIEHLDHSIGRVLTALDQNGQRDDTLVIFASDNGGELNWGASNGPLRGGKGHMWEGGVRVPMAASWKGHIAPGTSSGAVFTAMDIFATALDAAKVTFGGQVEAQSFLPVLEGRATAGEPRDLFFVRREGGSYAGDVYYGARSGHTKLVQNAPTDPFQLYDLESDPGEASDLAGQNPAEFARLLQLLQQHRKLADEVPWQ